MFRPYAVTLQTVLKTVGSWLSSDSWPGDVTLVIIIMNYNHDQGSIPAIMMI